MHQQALQLVQMLVKAGAVPGQHFSCYDHDEACHITEHGFDLLKQAYPSIEWDDLAQRVDIDHQEAVDTLHAYLGVDFVDRMLQCIPTRLKELLPPQASWYLKQVLGGVEQRTGIPLYLMLMEGMELSQQAHVQCLLHSEAIAEPCAEWIGDLLLAAGGTHHDFEYEGEEAILTERGVRLLAAVWAGEFNLYDVLAQKPSPN